MKCNKERFAECLVRETHFIEKCNLYAILNKEFFRLKLVATVELYFWNFDIFQRLTFSKSRYIFCYINALKVLKTFDAYIFFCHLLHSKISYH